MDVNAWDLPFSAESFGSNEVENSSPVKKRADSLSRRLSFTQIPTPPDSVNSSPVCDSSPVAEDMYVSVSTTFYPGATHHSLSPDITLLTQDHVFFYVHSTRLVAASNNRFKSLVPSDLSAKQSDNGIIINVPESSPILNIILHTLYEMSCTHYTPSFEILSAAIHLFPVYGIDLEAYVTPQSPLFNHLLSYAPLFPIELYALASHFDLFDLAAYTSSHLLSYQLHQLSDELVDQIGPRYLKRLFFLHMGRADALRRILLPPPSPHSPVPWCDFEEQKRLTRAWALASAYLAWDARPDLSVSSVESALSPLADHIACQLCQATLKDRVKNLVVQWSVVKRTI